MCILSFFTKIGDTEKTAGFAQTITVSGNSQSGWPLVPILPWAVVPACNVSAGHRNRSPAAPGHKLLHGCTLADEHSGTEAAPSMLAEVGKLGVCQQADHGWLERLGSTFDDLL